MCVMEMRALRKRRSWPFLCLLPPRATQESSARRSVVHMDLPEDEADFDDLARQQSHALRAEFARRLSDIRAGNRMRKATTASQPEKAAMAMESAATKWSAATRRPTRAETPSEAEEVEVESEAPLQAKASAKQRRKAKAAAPQAGSAADSTAMLRQPTVCEADVLETIATVRRSNVAASVTIHGWVVSLKIREGGASRPAPRHDLEVRAPGASDKWSGRLRSVDAVKRAMGLLPGATALELEASVGWDKGRAQEGGEPGMVDAQGDESDGDDDEQEEEEEKDDDGDDDEQEQQLDDEEQADEDDEEGEEMKEASAPGLRHFDVDMRPFTPPPLERGELMRLKSELHISESLSHIAAARDLPQLQHLP